MNELPHVHSPAERRSRRAAQAPRDGWNVDRLHAEYLNVHLFEGTRQQIVSHSHHEAAALIVVLSGGIGVTWEHAGRSGRFDARGGDTIYWPSGAQRVEINSARARLRCISAYFHWLDPVPHSPALVSDRLGTMRALGSSLLLAKDSQLPRRVAILNALLAAILAEFVRLAGPMENDLVERTQRYVQSHLREPIYLQDLARAAGLEKSYFCRRYRTLTGRSPIQDVQRIRAEHAAGVIRSSPGLPLKDVAPRAGVADEHQLSKLLKKYLGITARELRARIERGI